MKNLFFAFALSFLFPAFANSVALDIFNPGPSNVHKTAQSSKTISFDWDDSGGCNGYKVVYFRKQDEFTSQEYSTAVSNITFNDLLEGEYVFYFWTDYSVGASDIIVIEDSIEN